MSRLRIANLAGKAVDLVTLNFRPSILRDGFCLSLYLHSHLVLEYYTTNVVMSVKNGKLKNRMLFLESLDYVSL